MSPVPHTRLQPYNIETIFSMRIQQIVTPANYLTAALGKQRGGYTALMLSIGLQDILTVNLLLQYKAGPEFVSLSPQCNSTLNCDTYAIRSKHCGNG